MTACYGDGILGFVSEEIEGIEQKQAWATQFAALGLSHRFREVIDGKVLELAFKGGSVSCQWLPDADAAPIVAAAQQVGGSAPYSMFPSCLEVQIYVPGCRSSRGGTIAMANSSVDGWGFAPMRNAIADLEGWIGYLERGEVEGDLEFCQELLEKMRLCSEHRLLFTIGY